MGCIQVLLPSHTHRENTLKQCRTCAQLLLGWQNCYPWKELQAKCGNILDSPPETMSPTKKQCGELQAKRKRVKFSGNTMNLRVHLFGIHTGVHGTLLQVISTYLVIAIYMAIIYCDIIVILLIYQLQFNTTISLSSNHSNAKWILILISVLILITFCACVLVELDQFSCSPMAHAQLSVLWENSH